MHYFLVTVTDCPQEALLNEHVIDTVCATGKWKELGQQLLSENDIDVLEANESDDVKKKCSKMFKQWLDTQHTANWSQLIQALHQIKLSNLADKLNSMLLLRETQDGVNNTEIQNVLENILVHNEPADDVINGKFCV